MAKEAYYFSHDLGARNDPKLQTVLMKLGHAGKSVFWDLIEMLYEEGGYLNLKECENYAFALRTDSDCINKLINDFDLFKKDKNRFWSPSVLRRLAKRNEKSEKAAKSAKKRWDNPKLNENNANALPSDSERIAIKEIKPKEVEKKIINKLDEDIFSTDINLKESFEAFCKMRIKIKKPLTDHGIKLIKKDVWKLSDKNIPKSIEILDYSIKNSYPGVYDPQKNKNNKQYESNGTIPIERKSFKL